MVRADAGQAGTRALGRGCSGDSRSDGAKAEDRCAGCSAYSQATAAEAIPADLDSLAGGTGSPTAVAPSSQDGWPTNFGSKPVAGAGNGQGRLPKKEVVGGLGTDRTRRSGVRSLGASPTAGVAGDSISARSMPDGVGSSGRERSRATPRRLLLDGTTRCRTGHRFDVRVDHRGGGALPAEQTGSELSRAESPGE